MDLPEDASSADVSRAYRTLVKVWHPDRFAHDPELRRYAEAKLLQINTAHAWLEAHRGLLDRSRGSTPPQPTDEPPRAGASPSRFSSSETADRVGLRVVVGVVLVGSILGAIVIGIARLRPSTPAEDRESTEVPLDVGPAANTAATPVDPSPVVPVPAGEGPAFSLGTSRAELLRLQGTPTKVQDWGSWVELYFGRSSVQLKGDRVVGFVNEGSLHVDLTTIGAPEATRWTLGSSLAEVVGTQGTPTAVADWNDWMSLRYGRSTVKLEQGRVVGYYNHGELDVFLVPVEQRDSRDWAVGCLVDEIVSAEGTPTAVEDWGTGSILYYGRSYVLVRDGKVSSYHDPERRLSIRPE